MFGSFTANTPGTDFGEQMLNKVASQSIRHLFSESESVEVVIRCNPSSKLLQGSIDNFRMSGRNLLIRKDFHVEDMSFETDAVSIDFSSVLSGKIRLRQPTQAVAQVTLSQSGINRAFTAELVQKRLHNLDNPKLTQFSGGEPVSFSEVNVQLLPENQLKIFAQALLPNGAVPISLTATLAVERRRRLLFNDATFDPAGVPEAQQGISEILTMEFAEILNNMVDLDRFDLDGVMLRINRLETDGDRLVFSGYAQIDHFPKGS